MTFIQYRLRYGNSSLLSLDMNVIKENIEYDSFVLPHPQSIWGRYGADMSGGTETISQSHHCKI